MTQKEISQRQLLFPSWPNRKVQHRKEEKVHGRGSILNVRSSRSRQRTTRWQRERNDHKGKREGQGEGKREGEVKQSGMQFSDTRRLAGVLRVQQRGGGVLQFELRVEVLALSSQKFQRSKCLAARLEKLAVRARRGSFGLVPEYGTFSRTPWLPKSRNQPFRSSTQPFGLRSLFG